MATPLNKVYEVFLSQIDDKLLAFMKKDVVEDLLYKYLVGATNEFTTCKKNLNIVKLSESNDMSGYIEDDLDNDEIYILALGMIVYWLSPQILCEGKLKQKITDHDYKQLSNANMLNKLTALLELSEKRLRKKVIRYSHKNSKGWN